MPTIPVLVCFDLGGVCVRLQPDWASACAAAGVAVTPTLSDAQARAALTHLVQQSTLGRVGPHAFFAQAAALTGWTPADIRAISRAWLINPYPGIPELVTELVERGLSTACLSNTNAHHWQIVTGESDGNSATLDGPDPQYAFLLRMNYRVASHRVGNMKPAPAIYQYLEDRAGLSGSQIVYFDDVPEFCAAARARGWQAHLIDARGDTAAQCRAVLRDLRLL